MKKTNMKSTILFSAVLLLIMQVSSANSISNQALSSYELKSLNTAYAEVELSNIDDDLRLLSYVTKEFSKESNTNTLEKKISSAILRKIIMIKTLDPDIEILGGNAMVTLCLLTQSENKKILYNTGDSGDPQIAKLVENYLIGVKPIVQARITKLQQTMKGSGCYLTPR